MRREVCVVCVAATQLSRSLLSRRKIERNLDEPIGIPILYDGLSRETGLAASASGLYSLLNTCGSHADEAQLA